MKNLTVTSITPCYRTETDGTQTHIGECLKLQEVNTCVLGSQRVKGSMTYLFFTPTTDVKIGEVHQLDLSDNGPFKLDVQTSTINGVEVKTTKLWLK